MQLSGETLVGEGSWLEREYELTLQVKQLTLESRRVMTILLTSPDGRQLPSWKPGAHIDVHLGSSLVRQYSLCGDPLDLSHYRIGVLLEDVSLGGSTFVHQHLRPGDRVHVTGPRNRFALEAAQSYLFIAGGIGITPLLAMIRACQAANHDWRLLYAGRERAAMPFTAELTSYGERVEFHAADQGGRLDLAKVVDALQPGTEVYACGPETMLEELEEICHAQAAGVLHIERFKAKRREDTSETDRPFDVVLQQSGVTVTVPPSCSILAELERAGIEVPSSCREGICGTCEVTVLEGVPDHRDSLLSPEEQEAGTSMMVCVSRALSERLVLDI